MNSLPKKLAALGLSGALVVGGTLVAKHEGKENRVYLDPVGILTSCYGHTSPELKPGQTFTDEQCFEQLAVDLVKHDKQLRSVVKVPMSEGEHAAYLSAVYNFGIGNFRTSTALKLLNEGRRKDACVEVIRFVYAGKKFFQGLLNRRIDEVKVCLKDL